ncbi:MAG: GGDEF domain-containing protein [Lachnospiraceae bacterium]|nr:GGDEF domain-containing protein [Lachnospiraceae bacterium]
MKTMDVTVRKSLIIVLGIAVWVTFSVDIVFFLVYMITGTMVRTVPVYIINKLLLPFAVNMTAYQIAKRYNEGKTHENDDKNLVCSFALETAAGSVCIFHGYYVPLWVTPSIVILFCTLFHDERLQKLLLVYDYLLIICAAALTSWENRDNAYYYIQNAVIVIVMATLISLMASVMNKYNKEMAGITRNFHDKQLEYKEKLETDFLTGLYSRAYVEARAAEALKYCSEDNPCSIAMIDLDFFKSINDTYGHENGDKALETLGKVVASYMNDDLVAGRFGGEEFVLVFDGGEFDSHVMVLEDIREVFARQTYDFTENNITLSGGITCCTAPVEYQDALKLADEALYSSKKNGRNRITVASK